MQSVTHERDQLIEKTFSQFPDLEDYNILTLGTSEARKAGSTPRTFLTSSAFWTWGSYKAYNI